MDVVFSAFEAAEAGDLERVKNAVEQDAGVVHSTVTVGGTVITLLDRAVMGENVDLVQYLTDHGAVAHHRGIDRWTPLHNACLKGNAGIALVLLQGGLAISAVDRNGGTPLLYAARHGGEDVVRVLLEHGGNDMDIADEWGCTACGYASAGARNGVLRQLIEAGADPTLRDEGGRSPLDLARELGHNECINILQDWERAYLLQKARRVREAVSVGPSDGPQQGS